MRKLAAAFGKNAKLLFRSKETAFTIVFGPILIILLVGFAFMGSRDDLTIRVGTHAEAGDALSEQTIALLNAKGYQVSVYPDEQSCAQSVRDATTHACLSFSAIPGAWNDNNNTRSAQPHVTLYLDPSRMNLVDKISTDLSGVLDVQAGNLREGLANDAIQRINTAKLLVEGDVNITTSLSARLAAVSANLSIAKQSLGAVSDTPVNISLSSLRAEQLGLAQKVNIAVDTADAAITDADSMLRDLVSECADCSNSTKDAADALQRHLRLIQENLTKLSDIQTKDQLAQAQLTLDIAMDDVDALAARMRNDSASRRTIGTSVTAAAGDADSTAADMRKLDASLRYTRDLLAGQHADASDISAPISTSVVSVTQTDSQSAFSYPYLFVMVMMFMGLLLASTLIVTDKTSRAAFRNFTTPTPDGFQVFVAFLTAFVLLFAEAIVILLLSATFVAQPLLSDAPTTLAIVCVSIIVFTFLGMIIGYLSRTQEAAMIASISVGSVLLFVSNLVVPIEGMAALTQMFSAVNPYLVLSELLKRSMLFGVSMAQMASDLGMVIALAAVLLFITMMVQRRNKRKYFRQDGGILAPHIPAPLVLVGHYVNNEVELLDCLDHMTRAEFEAVVKADDNPISSWVKTELRNRSLARQLRTTSKEKMMLKLDKYLVHHGKHMSR